VFFDKLVKVDLTEPRPAPEPVPETLPAEPAGITLSDFLTDYLQRRTDVKASTTLVYEQVIQNLRKFFAPDVLLAEITQGHCIDFARYLSRQSYAKTTIDRRMSLARTILSEAVQYQHIERNPFDGIRPKLKNLMSRNNRTRKQLISADDILKVMEQCPDAEWRCLIALSRFGGLRVPSEALSLRWEHVDLPNGRMHVPCPKLEHLEGHDSRDVPIFAELRPWLEACWDAAEPGTQFVISRHRPPVLKSGAGWANANLRTRLEKFIHRAGLQPWPRLWHNLRASRQTELTDRFPQHVVCKWLGNSEAVASEHYLQVSDQHWQQAQTVMPQVMLSGAESGRTGPNVKNAPSTQLKPIQRQTAAYECMRPFSMEDGGLEPPTSCMPCKRSPS